MSDIQLFRLANGTANELPSQAAKLEKQLQGLIEANMPTFLGVRFLASEYATGNTHKGRIDSLGLDENGCPVIIEYKRHSNENVINQGLFYLDWLLDHQAEFRWLVMEKLGKDVTEQIDWSGTRLLCIATDFTRYDQHAVQQIPRNIELIRYKLFGDDLLLLELVNASNVPDAITAKTGGARETVVEPVNPKAVGKDKSSVELLETASPEVRDVYAQTAAFLNSLGDDVQEKPTKAYIAFRRLKNFACVVVKQQRLLIMLKLDPTTVSLEDGFTRDTSQTNFFGVELTLRTPADLERAKPMLERSYTEG
ncbi:DUF5655 domain-containing protein [Burkholderia seminalis]|uniref:DUF91 domain-containing protein n=2 Tax=Burkholderia cepacia complex TaxID=87882 RepID=A0A8A8D1Z5_9BURK|nr:DUF5655 domain-containing protein [Burkholderia seminalis]QTO18690.1 DUF91 domain-containing protein [Burkholderia seminalis]